GGCCTIVARQHRRQGRVERERCDRRKRQGADDQGPHYRLIFPALHIVRPFDHFSIDCQLAAPYRTTLTLSPGRLTELPGAVVAGQACQRRSSGLTDWPGPKSDVAIRMSTA